MKHQIVIKTRLHDGIYKSSGGGETRTHYSWSVGPRNLITAIKTLASHSASMENGYGNVGHCGSWIEIAGVRMEYFDFSDYEYNTDPSNFYDSRHSHAISKTEWCRNYIASVLDGSLEKNRIEYYEYCKLEKQAIDAGFDAGVSGLPMPSGFDDFRYQLKRGYNDGIHAAAEREEE